MKKTGHPEYVKARVVCSCGEVFETRATQPELRIEICSKCHPFYLGSGRQRMVEGGRVEKFQKKYGDYQARSKKVEVKAEKVEVAKTVEAPVEPEQAVEAPVEQAAAPAVEVETEKTEAPVEKTEAAAEEAETPETEAPAEETDESSEEKPAESGE